MKLTTRDIARLWRRSTTTTLLLLFAFSYQHALPGSALGQSVCGDGVRDFETETCDDGGRCQGGANEGQTCTTLTQAEACGEGTCVPVDGDLDFPDPGQGNAGDTCPANCAINRTCSPAGTVDVTVKFAQTCPCPGDCDTNGVVSVSELIAGVGIGLDTNPLDICPRFDLDDDGKVGIAELVSGVNSSVNGCPQDCGVDLTNGRFFFRYPDAKVRIPGSANDDSVIERIGVPFVGVGTPNDLDYAVRILLQADPFFAIDPDTLFTVTMDLCEGSEPPQAEDFRCSVFEAFASDASDVTDRTTCSVEIAP